MFGSPTLNQTSADVRVRDELISRIAHDVRTPIGAIATWLALLKVYSPSPQAARAIEMAERSARELTEIVSGAEDAQRIIAGTIQLQMAPLDLASLLRSVVESVLPQAKTRNILLDCETITPSRPANGDGALLRHAFARLLGHCVSLSGPGRVQVRLQDHRTDARVDLLCSALILSDPLRQALLDETEWPCIAGPCGQAVLDFALVCRVVGLHGGRLEAASLNPQGTRISASLPLARASAG